MEDFRIFQPIRVTARTQNQQLKMIMQLPVRIITDEKVLDILSIDAPNPVVNSLTERRLIINDEPFMNATPNEMIVFFHQCSLDELLTTDEVAKHYGVKTKRIRTWGSSGILKRYRLTNDLTLYKRGELPSFETIFSTVKPCLN